MFSKFENITIICSTITNNILERLCLLNSEGKQFQTV